MLNYIRQIIAILKKFMYKLRDYPENMLLKSNAGLSKHKT